MYIIIICYYYIVKVKSAKKYCYSNNIIAL